MAHGRTFTCTEEPNGIEEELRWWAEDLRGKDPDDADAKALERALKFIEYLDGERRKERDRVIALEQSYEPLRREIASLTAQRNVAMRNLLLLQPGPLAADVVAHGADFEVALRRICQALGIAVDEGRVDGAADLVRKIVAVVPPLVDAHAVARLRSRLLTGMVVAAHLSGTDRVALPE